MFAAGPIRDWDDRFAMRVLMVEDEARIHDFVRDALQAEGVALDSESTGPAGLRAALRENYDLIVLDLMLPGADGLTVLRALRRTLPDTPVLILTSRSELPVKLRGFDLGATDYMTKPFALEEFIARVRVQLRLGAGAGTTLRAGGMELDLVRRRVRYDGVEAELSEREFGVLRCLADQIGVVVTRERLLAEVWGIDFDPGTNVVDVCVRRLRKKLGPAAPIVTARNVGYYVTAR